MAFDIMLDNNGDFDISKGDFIFIDNDLRVVQQIKIRLMTWKNEWFLDENKGVDYLNIFATRRYAKQLIENMIREMILEVPNVDSVENVTLIGNASARSITIRFDVIINLKHYSDVLTISAREVF